MSKANPNLLQLLEAGATVEFSNGVKLVGLPSEAYIRIVFDGTRHGVWSLDKEGLKNALEDGEKLFAEDRGDDFSDIAKAGYGILICTFGECIEDGMTPSNPKKLKDYNIVSEGGDWLEGSDSRVEIRRRYLKRLELSHA